MRTLAHLAFMICLLASASVYATQDEAARLYEEARQLYERWEASDDTAEALGNLELARARLDVIVQRHPGSSTASQLVLGDPLQRRLDIALAKHWERAEALRADSRDDWDACLATLSSECLFDLALAAARDVDFEHHRAQTFARIGLAQAKAEHISAALQSFELAHEAARLLPSQVARITLEDVAELQAQAGIFEGAALTIDGIISGKVAIAYIRALVDYGRLDEALLFAKNADNSVILLYHELIFTKLTERGELALALELISNQDQRYQEVYLFALAPIMARLGHVDRALSITRSSGSEWGRANNLLKIAQTLGEAQSARAGTMILNEARRIIVDQNTEIWRTAEGLLSNLAKAEAALGLFDAAYRTLERMSVPFVFAGDPLKTVVELHVIANKTDALNYVFSPESGIGEWTIVVMGLVDALVAHSHLDEALSVAQRSESIGIRSYSLRQIAAAWARAGETDLALQMAREISEAQWRASALGEIALAVSQQ